MKARLEKEIAGVTLAWERPVPFCPGVPSTVSGNLQILGGWPTLSWVLTSLPQKGI